MVLGSAPKIYSQTFAFQQFTTEDGLPGSTVYSIIQDKDQVLWIATDGGICKFDGHTFEPLKDENIQGEIIRFYTDSGKNIWMIDLAQNISLWSEGELSRFQRNLDN